MQPVPIGQSGTPPRRRARVTIADVAAALGLTKGTVSRALNDYPDIAEGTRMRVRRKAEAMGYHPLSQAQAIRTGRARSLALVLQTDVHDAHRPFLANFLAGLTRVASARNWTLTVASARSEDEMLATFQRLTDERKADGFVLPRTLVDDPRVTYLRDAGVPFVMYGRTRDPQGCAWFDIRGEDAMKAAVLRLAALGHRRIGYVGALDRHMFSRLREEGFRAGMAEAGLEIVPENVRGGAVTREEGEVLTQAMLHGVSPPTAIVFAVDLAALGAYRALAHLGFEVGRDVSIISYDGIPEAAYADPPLSTFAVDTELAGERLADMLIDLVRGTPPETLRETRAARLCAGGSDGAPRMTSEEIARRLRD